MPALDDFARTGLATLEAKDLRRTLQVTERLEPPLVRRDGRPLISFACNDYLNLSWHPDVVEAAVRATQRYGTGSGASRLVTGNHPLFRELEVALADHNGTGDVIVFGSGYLANAGIIPALAGRQDLILADRLVHASIIDGIRLSGATLHRFRHNNVAHAAALLYQHRASFRHCLIVTETVFSMDGDRAPVSALADLADTHEAWLMTDDAHGLGLIEKEASPRVPLQLGTLSKTLGSYGAYLCASTPVCDYLRSMARSLIYSTGLPSSAAAAALAALRLIEAHPEWGGRALAKAGLFAAQMDLPPAQSAIVPVIVGDSGAALQASQALAEAGFLVTAIRPPTVPPGRARLRFTFSPAHSDEDVVRVAQLTKTLIKEIR